MALPLHEKDLNTMGASSLPERRLPQAGKPAQEMGSYTAKPQLLQSGMGTLKAAIGARSSCRVSSEIGCVEGKSGNSPAPPPAGPTKTHLQSVEDMLRHLKQNKLTEGRPIKPQAQRSSTSCDNVCLVGENSGRIKWIQPSGPRRNGEGTEDEEQGIIAADSTTTGGARVRITLLAAGFVIGSSGSSVREISKQTGADIKSWTEKPDHKSQSSRPTRSFVIEGKKRAVVLALDIMCDAVDRYKELCEGRYCGQFVGRIQKVRGVEFSYQPPPRNIVPYAAALKGQHPRLTRGEAAVSAVPAGSAPVAAGSGVTTYSSNQAASTSSSVSTQGADSCSEVADGHHTGTLPDNQTALHSKAQVMQNYLSAQGSAKAHSESHSSSLITQVYGSQESTYPSSPVSDDITPSNAASRQISGTASRLYITPHPVQGSQGFQGGQCSFAPRFGPDVNPFASTPKEQGPVSMTGKPMDLVQIQPNVWLPLTVVQQAGGDPDLALHLASQGQIAPDTHADAGNPPAHNGWGVDVWAQKHLSDSSLMSQKVGFGDQSNSHHHVPFSEPELHFSTQNDLANSNKAKMQIIGSEWTVDDSKQTSSDSRKAAGRSMHQSGFDPIIGPPANNVGRAGRAGMPVVHTAPNSHAPFSFKSPTVSMPSMGSNSTFISPQCVLDNSSLFSYGVATPEQASHSSTSHPWYSTPEAGLPQGWGHNFASNGTPNTACYYPELNPSAAKHMSEMYGLGSGGRSLLPHVPHGLGSGGPYWQDPSMGQFLPEYGVNPTLQMSHTNMAAAMGAHDSSPHLPGDSPLPWIQGTHPLRDQL